MTGRRAVLAWTVAALAGLALTVALALATSRLVAVHVGLAGEPPTAGQELAPVPRTAPAQTAPARTTPAPAPRPPAPSGDDGESGEDD